MVRKRDLEIALSRIPPHPSPKAYLEQYTIPPEVAAEMLYIAAYTYDDIVGKRVVDLGCGTGRLAIGAALLGAEEVVGVDLDEAAVRTAYESAKELGVGKKASWVIGDIEAIRGGFDTVLQNPPFGVQRRAADRAFLSKALNVGSRIYSLHKGGNRKFIERFIEERGGRVTDVIPLELSIPHVFEFHSKRKHVVKVELYRAERLSCVAQ